MGRLLLVGRLAARDLRRRPAEAALLLLAITAATAILTLGLALRGVISKPYQTTREATAGPDVVTAFGGPADAADVKALTDESGVVAHSGPYPVVATQLEANGRTVVAQAEGRDTAAAAVDQPKPTKGGWVRDGGVVLEAAFAEALGVSPGDRVTLKRLAVVVRDGKPSMKASGAGRSFVVAGVAVTAATPPYPEPACLANLCQGGCRHRRHLAHPRRPPPRRSAGELLSPRPEPEAERPRAGPGLRRPAQPAHGRARGHELLRPAAPDVAAVAGDP